MHSILVKDYMDYNPHTINASSNVKEVVEQLLNQHILGAPVISSEQQLIGYISEQECIKEMLNDAFYCEEPTSVCNVMVKDVISVSPDTSIIEIAQTMLKRHPKNYPVVESGKLIGIINRAHILKALLENEQDCYLQH